MIVKSATREDDVLKDKNEKLYESENRKERFVVETDSIRRQKVPVSSQNVENEDFKA